MNPVPPQDLLSAYLDGELSPAERERVERLLEQSPKARQELRELEQVGELLRQLPRESLPITFASELLDIRLSEKAVAEDQTEAPNQISSTPSTNGRQSRRSFARMRKLGWLGLAAVGISAAGLVVMINRPEPSAKDGDAIAMKAPNETAAGTAQAPGDWENGNPVMPMAAESATPPEESAQAEFQAGPPDNRAMIARDRLPRTANVPAPPSPEADQALQPLLFSQQAELKDLRLEKLPEALAGGPNEVAVVKLMVEDRPQALRQLKALLARHQIAPPDESDRERAEFFSADGKQDSALVAMLVQAGDDQLTAAIRELPSASAVKTWSMQAPISLARLDSALARPNAVRSVPFRKRMMPFRRDAEGTVRGYRSAPKVGTMQTRSQPGEAQPLIADPAAAGNALENQKPQAERAPAENAAPVRFGIRSFAPAVAEKPADERNREPSQPAAAPTVRQLRIPADVLNSLQKPASDPQTHPAQRPEPMASPKRAQVLFVLVDQPATAEPASRPPGNRD